MSQTTPSNAPVIGQTPASDDGLHVLRIGHSPDPDDAFMWYPLADFVAPNGQRVTPQVDTEGFRFVHVLEDIQSLNERSERGELEITAISIHEYPFIADKYVLTACGSSMGDGYGPMIVTNPRKFENVQVGGGFDARALQGKRLAIPGLRTSAWLSCQLWLAEAGMGKDDLSFDVVMFDEVPNRVAAGEFDAGLLIHEGQLTYANDGLELGVDLGQWWTDSRGLPLPLGGNCIRRDVGKALVEVGVVATEAEGLEKVCRVLRRSIDYALANRGLAIDFAMQYARDLDTGLADRFVGMYVNDWTLDYGDKGRAAVRRLLAEGATAGLVPDTGEIDFIGYGDNGYGDA